MEGSAVKYWAVVLALAAVLANASYSMTKIGWMVSNIHPRSVVSSVLPFLVLLVVAGVFTAVNGYAGGSVRASLLLPLSVGIGVGVATVNVIGVIPGTRTTYLGFPTLVFLLAAGIGFLAHRVGSGYKVHA